MQKNIHSLYAALCCVCLCLSVAHAQQTYWGISYEEYPNYVFHMNSNALDRTQAYNADEANNSMGSYPDRVTRGADGAVYAINSWGGQLDIDDLGFGTVLKITPDGIHKIVQLTEYAENVDFSLVDNQNGYLYGIGCAGGCFGSYLWKISTNGTEIQKKRIVMYGLSTPSSVIRTSDGEIMGLSRGAGTSNRGMIFKILPDLSNISIVFSFSGPDGKTPLSNLLQGQDGFLYGTTSTGGIKNLGVIYKIKTDGSEFTILHDYSGSTDGRSGNHLVQDSNGYIYGDTPTGGNFKKGNIFRMKPDGSEYVSLFDFDGVNISNASDHFTLDSDGYLNFLMGPYTGSNEFYKIKTDGTGLTKVFGLPTSMSIQLITSNLEPANTFIHADVNNVPIEGTFSMKKINNALKYTLELSEAEDFSVLSFSGVSEDTTVAYSGLDYSKKYYARVKTNAWPEYGPTTSFNTSKPPRLWGITTSDGINYCGDNGSGIGGTIFSIDLNGEDFVKHYDPPCEDGDGDFNNLSRSLISGQDHFMYGLVYNGATASTGGIIKIDPEGNLTNVYNNMAVSDGDIMQASNGMLYVNEPYSYVTQNASLLHELNPDGSSGYSSLIYLFRFRARSGYHNFGAPIDLEDGYLYGLTAHGGDFGRGVMYKISLDGSSFSVLHHFDLPTGKNPKGSLLKGDDGFLYGMTSSGGTKNYGGIFKIKKDGTGYSLIHSFNSYNGRFPEGNLIMANNVLYGMANEGGIFKSGVIFRINSDGTNYTILHHFNRVTTGANPKGSLINHQGFLYGMTSAGGTNNFGVLFKIKADGSGFKKMLDFSTETGGAPNGNLILVNPLPGHSTAAPTTARLASNTIMPEKSIAEKSVKVYPNPSTNSFTIELTDTKIDHSRFVISDIQGRPVFGSTLLPRNPVVVGESLPTGLYILKILLPGKSDMIRLIKR